MTEGWRNRVGQGGTNIAPHIFTKDNIFVTFLSLDHLSS